MQFEVTNLKDEVATLQTIEGKKVENIMRTIEDKIRECKEENK